MTLAQGLTVEGGWILRRRRRVDEGVHDGNRPELGHRHCPERGVDRGGREGRDRDAHEHQRPQPDDRVGRRVALRDFHGVRGDHERYEPHAERRRDHCRRGGRGIERQHRHAARAPRVERSSVRRERREGRGHGRGGNDLHRQLRKRGLRARRGDCGAGGERRRQRDGGRHGNVRAKHHLRHERGRLPAGRDRVRWSGGARLRRIGRRAWAWRWRWRSEHRALRLEGDRRHQRGELRFAERGPRRRGRLRRNRP